MAKIAIKVGHREYETTRLCLNTLHPEVRGMNLIKPNFFKHIDYPKGSVTDLNTIKATTEYILGRGGEVRIGEGGINRRVTDFAFNNFGIRDYCKEASIELINFFKSPTVKIKTPDFTVNVTKSVTEADRIFSLCKLKVHLTHAVSLSCKNLMGCVVGQRRVYFHSGKGLASDLYLNIQGSEKPVSMASRLNFGASLMGVIAYMIYEV